MDTTYLIEMLNGITGFFIFTGIICVILGLIFLVLSGYEDVADKASRRSFLRRSITLLSTSLLCIFLFVMIPNTKQAYRIYGIGGTIEYLQGNKGVKALPSKTFKILNKWADSYLENDSIN